MSFLTEWLGTANPPGAREAERDTVTARGKRYVPFLQRIGRFFRRNWPVLRLGSLTLVFLHDDVEEILSRPDVFAVPFGEEMARLNDGMRPGTPFILGIDDAAHHDAQAQRVMRVFARQDIADLVAKPAAVSARAIVQAAGNELEAVTGLIRQVPLDIVQGYYGVKLEDPADFAQAAITVSGHLFGLPPIEKDDDTDAAAAKIRAVVDAALKDPPAGDTIATRLARCISENSLSFEEARAFLIGMIVGFVPTNTMAGAHILDSLLEHEEMLAAARDAAREGDDDLLAHVLFEALRFYPINPGPFRICRRDYVLGEGTDRECVVKEGARVWALTWSAMFDERVVVKPFHFVPARPASTYMHFGFGMHWCVGFYIARAQLVQTFKPLVLAPGLRRKEGPDGKLGGINPFAFPESLWVEL